MKIKEWHADFPFHRLMRSLPRQSFLHLWNILIHSWVALLDRLLPFYVEHFFQTRFLWVSLQCNPVVPFAQPHNVRGMCKHVQVRRVLDVPWYVFPHLCTAIRRCLASTQSLLFTNRTKDGWDDASCASRASRGRAPGRWNMSWNVAKGGNDAWCFQPSWKHSVDCKFA